jgi:hypothetical protein
MTADVLFRDIPREYSDFAEAVFCVCFELFILKWLHIYRKFQKQQYNFPSLKNFVKIHMPSNVGKNRVL